MAGGMGGPRRLFLYGLRSLQTSRQRAKSATPNLANPSIPPRGAMPSGWPPGWRQWRARPARCRRWVVAGRGERRRGRRGGGSGSAVRLTGGFIGDMEQYYWSNMLRKTHQIVIDFMGNPSTKNVHTSEGRCRHTGSLLRQAQFGRRFRVSLKTIILSCDFCVRVFITVVGVAAVGYGSGLRQWGWGGGNSTHCGPLH